jgi:hypothetical protein
MEARDPSNEFNQQRRTTYYRGSKTKNGLNPLDPSHESDGHRSRTSSKDSRSSGSNHEGRRQSSVELLPGLEPDDIVPGITDVWKNVQQYMQLTRDGADMDSSVDKVSAELKKVGYPSKRYEYDIKVVDRSDDSSGSAVEIAPKKTLLPRVKDMMKKAKIVPPRYKRNKSDKYDVSDTGALSTIAITDVDGNRSGDYNNVENHANEDEDADCTIAEDQPQKSLHRHPESDDTLWGFLTCRATADI